MSCKIKKKRRRCTFVNNGKKILSNEKMMVEKLLNRRKTRRIDINLTSIQHRFVVNQLIISLWDYDVLKISLIHLSDMCIVWVIFNPHSKF